MSEPTNFHTISNLRLAEQTYTERNKTYGDNYKKFGHVMQALFPHGVTINSAEQWNRFGVLIQKVSKLSRYVTNPYEGHLDSVHDDICYSAMLEELDAAMRGLDTTSPVSLVTSETHAARPSSRDLLVVKDEASLPSIISREEIQRSFDFGARP